MQLNARGAHSAGGGFGRQPVISCQALRSLGFGLGYGIDRKSYSVNAICINGNLIAWFTRKHHVVAVSSTKTERIVISDV